MAWPFSQKRNHPSELRLVGTLDLTAKEGDSGPPKFRLLVNTGQPMRVPGFLDKVVIDLAGAKFAKAITPVVMDHDTTRRIGHTTRQEITNTAIVAEGVVSSSMGIAQGFVADAKAGFPFEVSVGAIVDKAEFIDEGKTAKVNGREHAGPLLVARKSTIRELTVTVLGADRDTSATIAGTQSSQPNEVSTMSDLDQERKLRAAEEARIDGIKAAAANRQFDGLKEVSFDDGETKMTLIEAKQHAIKNGLTQSDFELALFRSNLRANDPPHPPMIRTGVNLLGEAGQSALECAVARHAGVDVEKHYQEQTLHAADRLPVTCLMDAFKMAVRTRGEMPDWRNKDDVIRAAFSTTEISTLLSNVAGKSLEDAYKAYPSVAKLVSRKLNANTFHEHTGVRLTGDVEFLHVAGDGELKHGTLADSHYAYQLGTYARMLGITRTDIVNDDLNGLDSIPRMLGRGAAIALEKVWFTVFLANLDSQGSAFFSVANANLVGPALSAGGLATAVQAFLEQVDDNGDPVNAVPRWLVMPPALKATGDELYVARTLNVGGGDTTNDARIPAENIAFGKYEPACSPYLGASVQGLSGASNTAWYLFSNAQDVAAMGIAYLGGRELPTIEQSDQQFNLLGVQWRGYLDFAVCMVDHRGAVKSTGSGSVGSS